MPESTKKNAPWQEVQDTVSRLASHKGVLAISILNPDGNIVTQQVTSESIQNDGSSISVLGNPKLLTTMMKTANAYVQSISGHEPKEDDTSEDISFVRIRTQKDEILVAPKLGYTLVVLQDPSISSL